MRNKNLKDKSFPSFLSFWDVHSRKENCKPPKGIQLEILRFFSVKIKKCSFVKLIKYYDGNFRKKKFFSCLVQSIWIFNKRAKEKMKLALLFAQPLYLRRKAKNRKTFWLINLLYSTILMKANIFEFLHKVISLARILIRKSRLK